MKNMKNIKYYLLATLLAYSLSGCNGCNNCSQGDNVPPISQPQELVIEDESSSVNILLDAIDEDGDPLTYIIIKNPSHGVLSGNLPSVIYTPNENWEGEDSFTFISNDGNSNSEDTIIKILTKKNHAPTAENQSLSLDNESIINIVLNGSDSDGDELTFEIISQPSNGILTGEAPNLVYTPNTDYVGEDSFEFRTNDGKKISTTATILLDVVDATHSPIISGSPILSLNENTVYDFIPTATDSDGDLLTFSVNNLPSWASFDTATGEISGKPAYEDDHGIYENIEIIVSDGEFTDSMTFNIEVIDIRPFIMRIKTNNMLICSNQLESDENQFRVAINGNTSDYDADWGDGSDLQEGLSESEVHTFPAEGEYIVKLYRDIGHLEYRDYYDPLKILSLEQWGDTVWTSFHESFQGERNLVDNTTDLPILSNVTNMSFMFFGTIVNNPNVNDYNMSTITNISNMFRTSKFNQPLD